MSNPNEKYEDFISPREVGNLRCALLGLEGALHQIAYHPEQFKSMEEMSEFAQNAVDWADVESTEQGLFANPGTGFPKW